MIGFTFSDDSYLIMLDGILKVLRETPRIRAREIAKKLQLDKHDVTRFLHAETNNFQIDDDYCWAIKNADLVIMFPADCWINCDLFESALSKVQSPLESVASSIIFVIPKGCNLLLEAIARLMALSNQLAYNGKEVTIDFTRQNRTLSYVDRLGFFEHLDKRVNVLPKRPNTSRAKIYNQNSDSLVELAAIDPSNPDASIPKRLKNVFVLLAGDKYDQDAYTVLSELFGNVLEHSELPIPGFIGLQFYENTFPRHIQTVISDSGKGILGTLKPIFAIKYPDLNRDIKHSGENFDIQLLKLVFMRGQISQSDEDGRGLGLKSSSKVASKYSAKILVRQENCEISFNFKQGKLEPIKYKTELPLILGTHICFDFELD